MRDGVINVVDSDTNVVEISVKVHLRREYPEPIIRFLCEILKKGIEDWEDRVIRIEIKDTNNK